MKHSRKLIHLPVMTLFVVIGTWGLLSCASIKPVDVPTDLSPAKFFQIVQEMVDNEQYDNALVYLGEFKTRNAGSPDVAIQDKLMEGEYLVAQIKYKQGHLAEARDLFAALLKQYDGIPEKASSPPQWIRVLSAKMIDSITKKLPTPKESPAPNPAESAPAN